MGLSAIAGLSEVFTGTGFWSDEIIDLSAAIGLSEETTEGGLKGLKAIGGEG